MICFLEAFRLSPSSEVFYFKKGNKKCKNSGPCFLVRCDLITERVRIYVKCKHYTINTACKKINTYLSCQHHCAHIRNVYNASYTLHRKGYTPYIAFTSIPRRQLLFLSRLILESICHHNHLMSCTETTYSTLTLCEIFHYFIKV